MFVSPHLLAWSRKEIPARENRRKKGTERKDERYMQRTVLDLSLQRLVSQRKHGGKRASLDLPLRLGMDRVELKNPEPKCIRNVESSEVYFVFSCGEACIII